MSSLLGSYIDYIVYIIRNGKEQTINKDLQDFVIFIYFFIFRNGNFIIIILFFYKKFQLLPYLLLIISFFFFCSLPHLNASICYVVKIKIYDEISSFSIKNIIISWNKNK